MISSARVYQLPIFGFDVVGYSHRTTRGQADIQRVFQDVLKRTMDGLDAEILGHEWLNQGDGGFIALQGHIQLCPQFLSRFAHHLEDVNKQRREDTRIEMRYALHFGIIRVETERVDRAVSGDGIIILARLLSGMPHDRPGQVVISGSYKRMLTDEADMSEKHFERLADIRDKHGNVHEMWNFRNDNAGI